MPAVDPQRVVHIVGVQLGEPGLGFHMDFADFSDDPGIDLLLHPLELGQIFLLVADHGLDAVLMAQTGHLPGLLQGFGHGLFQGNSLHAVFDPQLN